VNFIGQRVKLLRVSGGFCRAVTPGLFKDGARRLKSDADDEEQALDDPMPVHIVHPTGLCSARRPSTPPRSYKSITSFGGVHFALDFLADASIAVLIESATRRAD
jgi:hypothetical protein